MSDTCKHCGGQRVQDRPHYAHVDGRCPGVELDFLLYGDVFFFGSLGTQRVAPPAPPVEGVSLLNFARSQVANP